MWHVLLHRLLALTLVVKGCKNGDPEDLFPPDDRRTWMDWIEVERDEASGKPVASLRTCGTG